MNISYKWLDYYFKYTHEASCKDFVSFCLILECITKDIVRNISKYRCTDLAGVKDVLPWKMSQFSKQTNSPW